MGKQPGKQAPPRHTGWRRVTLGALGLLAVGAAAFWGLSGTPDTSGGTPRLVVDRTEIDLGYRRFDTPVRAAFTLTNTGTGMLRLREAPPVILRAGC